MKKIKSSLILLCVVSMLWSCSEDVNDSNVNLSFTATPSANNPNTILLDNTSTATSGTFMFWQYSKDGVHITDLEGIEEVTFDNPGTYEVTLTAVSAGKIHQISQNIVITTTNIFSCDDANAILLADVCANGATGKTWVWSTLGGAYGVGPAPNYDSADPADMSWFAAGANAFKQADGTSCVYDDEYIFKQDETHTYINKNNDTYQWIWSWANKELGTNNAQYADGCYKSREPESASWSINYRKGNDGKTYPWLVFTNKASIAMYEGVSEYQIVSLSADQMTLRNIAKDPDPAKANGWRYYKLIRKGFVETVPVAEPDIALKDAANFNVGMIVNSNNLSGKKSDIILREFDNITSEYEMKMDKMYPSKGTYDFTAVDKIVKYAVDNNLNLHGHALIWHNSVPDWVTNFSGSNVEFETMIKDYITTVVTRYKGKVKSWDVVNEAVDDGSGNPLRNSIFKQKMGNDYIKKCYQWARDADPACKLFYNDYNFASSSSKRAAIFKIADDLKKDNLIDGLGAQMHIAYNGPAASQIQAVADGTVSRNLLMHFSELDIRANPDNDLTSLTVERAVAQQNKYKEVVKIFNAIPSANRYALTVWGMRDSESWLINFWGHIDWALMYNDDYSMKKAHTGFLDGLK
ncbi:MAG: endo-1,4-beta-xylanase [Bacteroidetes bacterium]|nr:endo-1,4-beta-xylanase [Bacteroidota bacterium]